MPLTLSHPAAVLPLRRLGLPMTVLIVATMVPDVPLFLGSVRGYDLTHSLVGIVTIDVLMALGAAAAWTFVARDALVDMAPERVRSRLAPRVRLTAAEWVLAPAAAVIGAATHVAWDSFTHPGAWGARRIDWLRADHAGLAGTTWAQHVSGVVGLAIVVAATVAHLRAQRPGAARGPRRLPAATLPVVVGVAAATAIVSAARSVSRGLDTMAFHGVVDALIVLTVGLALVSLAWHVAGMREPRRGLHSS